MGKLHVFYRTCSHASERSVLYGVDKMSQIKVFLISFLNAFKNVPYDITFILDSCPPYYRSEIEAICKQKVNFFEAENMGNVGSYLKQIELISELKDGEKVYLAEDDYLYVSDAGEKLINGLDVCQIITLYDHPDYYKPLHATNGHIEIFDKKQQWISRRSTCLTYGTKAGIIKKNRKMFERYGVNDYKMWCGVTKKYDLFSPVPSLATHAVIGLLAPNIDWKI